MAMSEEGQYLCKPLAGRSITNSNEGDGPESTRRLRARLHVTTFFESLS